MKRILFITVSAPGNRGGGGEVYTAELLRELSSFCMIDLVYFRYKDKAIYEPCNANVRVIRETIIDQSFKIRGFLSTLPVFPYFSARYSKKVSSFLKKQVEDGKYDAVYFDHSQTFAYVKDIIHPCKILMCHDVVAQNYMRRKSKLTCWVKASEKALLSSGNAIFTLSEKDCDLIRDFYGINSFHTTLYVPEIVKKTFPTEVGDYYVMFGAWGRPENCSALQWMIGEIAPKINKQIKIKIIGGGVMPADLRAKVESLPFFEYVGFVDNPYPIIANAIAEIVPLIHGAGVKVKCVEALACGTPVIGTDVAFEGIPRLAGTEELMIKASGVEEIVNAIQSVHVGIEKRIMAKNAFCAGYDQKNIVAYIRNDFNERAVSAS